MGAHPCREWTPVAQHSPLGVTEFEGQPHRRPLTYDEVQALFDAADGRVEEIRARSGSPDHQLRQPLRSALTLT
jgi:hypothetical protein